MARVHAYIYTYMDTYIYTYIHTGFKRKVIRMQDQGLLTKNKSPSKDGKKKSKKLVFMCMCVLHVI